MNDFLVKEAERLAGAQIHDVRCLIATYSNWFTLLECRPSCKDLCSKKLLEYENLLASYVQIRKMGSYPDIKKLKDTYLSFVEV